MKSLVNYIVCFFYSYMKYRDYGFLPFFPRKQNSLVIWRLGINAEFGCPVLKFEKIPILRTLRLDFDLMIFQNHFVCHPAFPKGVLITHSDQLRRSLYFESLQRMRFYNLLCLYTSVINIRKLFVSNIHILICFLLVSFKEKNGNLYSSFE